MSQAPSNGSFREVFPWVFLVSCMFLCLYLSRAVFGPLLPYIEDEFGISHAASTRLLLYLSVGYALGLLTSGYVATLMQPRSMAGYSILGSGVLLLCIAFLDGLAAMPVLLIILGLIGGQYLNGGMRVMRDIVQPSQWSMAVALHEMGPNACFLLVPVVAELLASRFGWRFAIEVMGWICIGFGVLFLLIAKGGRVVSPRLSLGGLRGIIRNPVSWLFAWLASVGVAGEIAAYSVTIMYLTEERGMASDSAAYLLSLSRIAAPFTVFVGGWLCGRFGTKRSLVICLTLFALSLFLFAMPWKPAYLFGLFLHPTVAAMFFPPIFTLIVEYFRPEDQTTIMAFGMPIASFVGMGVTPALLGLSGDLLSFSAGFVIFGLAAAAALPMLAILSRAKSQAAV